MMLGRTRTSSPSAARRQPELPIKLRRRRRARRANDEFKFTWLVKLNVNRMSYGAKCRHVLARQTSAHSGDQFVSLEDSK